MNNYRFQVIEKETGDVLKDYSINLMPGDCYSEMGIGDSIEYGTFEGVKETELIRVA